ncbi:hypothetical protein P691DRAFT_626545, partial [Macrolepiota fuliginosa MF-IS2]
VAEEDHAPLSQDLLFLFILALTGAYSSSTIINYVSRVWVWHLLYGLIWTVDKPAL